MKITNTQPGAMTVAGITIDGKASIDVSDAQLSAMKKAAEWAFKDGWLVAGEPVKAGADGAKLHGKG